MTSPSYSPLTLTETDLDFLVGEAAPGASNKERLKQMVREDKDFRRGIVGDEVVFQRVMRDEEVLVKISPALYFEVLLRRALAELETVTHTVERAGRQSIPIFDSQMVVDLLARPELLEYLAQMLASFTRIQSYVVPVRVRRGVRRRVRYNDMDIDSLLRFCATAEEPQRFGFYKRIADVCLFLSGVFPEHTFSSHSRTDGRWRPAAIRRLRRSLEDYETEGRRFYGLAEGHPAARELRLTEVFALLRSHFTSARKPLSFIASNYLHSRSRQLFHLQAR